MYNKKFVSVVFATYKEKKSIKSAIESFFNTGFVDEIIVVNNNAEKGTEKEVNDTKAKMIYEKRQGYGYAFQTGIENAKGDYIILCEPDGSYTGNDLERLLVYAKGGFEVVFGSRTNQSSPLSGADITFWRKWANVIEAKSIEVLFNTNSLTDIGCTYKLFKKDALRKISKQWKTRSSLFATELILLTVTNNLKFVELPITFSKRKGESSFTSKWYLLVKWGLHIQAYILIYWLQWVLQKITK